MTDPAKTKGFLELFGAWDMSLALLMGSAVGVAALAFTAAMLVGMTTQDRWLAK